MSTPAFMFADFEPGKILGERTEIYDDTKAQLWRQIFGQAQHGEASAAEAASMALANMMRAYLNVLTPRPPGNIHAKQRLRLHSLPRSGETMKVTVRCVGKEVRRERKYVELQVEGFGADTRPVFAGLATLIWAA